MAKKNTPTITHTETLCYAIRHLESEIEDMRRRCEGKPGAEGFLKDTTDRLAPKLDALKEMYRMETGAEYV